MQRTTLPFAVQLSGVLNIPAARRAAAAIVMRHEVLRTTFPIRDGRPIQYVSSREQLDWAVCDLLSVSPSERDRTAQMLGVREAAKPFDLQRGPLLRVRLLRLNYDDHVLLLTMHHIISDAWSIEVLVRDFTALYAGFCQGYVAALPPLPIQYGDYAAWQRSWLTGNLLATQVSYWRTQLAELSPLELPTDYARPAERSPSGAVVAVTFDDETTASFRAVCQQEGVTLFMLLLAAFQLALGRYAGQTDVAVGTVVANRTRVETEHLIGFFINTLVLRTDVGGVRTVRDLLARVREITLGAYSHQDVPFEHLVDVLQPQRDLARSPLFQVFLSLNNVPVTRSRDSGRYDGEVFRTRIDSGEVSISC